MKTVNIILAMVLALFIYGCGKQSNSKRELSPVKEVSYKAESGNYLKVIFDQKQDCVTILLDGGQKLTLPRALSGSGARYRKGQDIFWEHHGLASFWRGDKLIFRGKIVKEQDKH